MNKHEFIEAVIRKMAEYTWSAIPADVQARMNENGFTKEILYQKVLEAIPESILSEQEFEVMKRTEDIPKLIDTYAKEIAADRSFDVKEHNTVLGTYQFQPQ